MLWWATSENERHNRQRKTDENCFISGSLGNWWIGFMLWMWTRRIERIDESRLMIANEMMILMGSIKHAEWMPQIVPVVRGICMCVVLHAEHQYLRTLFE